MDEILARKSGLKHVRGLPHSKPNVSPIKEKYNRILGCFMNAWQPKPNFLQKLNTVYDIIVMESNGVIILNKNYAGSR